MELTRISILRPLFITMAVLALVIFGLVSYTRLGVDLWPNVSFPAVTVVTVYPGAGPESVEELVTKPIEDALAGVTDLDYLQSSSTEGVSYVAAIFTERANADTAALDVERRVSSIRSTLPQDVRPPSLVKADLQSLPIMNISLSGPLPLEDLFRLADDKIANQLATVRGVASAKVVGGFNDEVVVKIDQSQLRARGLSILQISAALAQENVNLPSGSVEQGGLDYDVRLNAYVQKPEELQNLIVSMSPTGVPIYLRDVASVEVAHKKQTQINRTDGRDSVGLVITKQSGANTIQVADAVKKALKSLEPSFPAGVEAKVATDESIFTRQSLNDLQRNLIEAVVLTALVLLLFLHTWRSTIIVLLSIPTSLISTFAVMNLLGFSLNMMSMMALALTVGILVDDSIVVLENIFRHLHLGETPWTAALNGRNEIGLAAIAITLVDVVVYTPVALMSGVVGQYFRQFGLSVTAATLFSLLISFTLVPMLSSRWLRVTAGNSLLDRFGRVWEAGYDRLIATYRGVLAWALRWRWLVIGAGVAAFVLGLAPIFLQILPTEFMPEADAGEVVVYLEMPPGTTLDGTNQVMRTMEDRVSQWSEVKTVFASVGVSDGMTPDQSRFGRLYLRLVPKNERGVTAQQLAARGRTLGEGIAGAHVRAQVPSFLGMGGQAIMLQIQGPDSDTLTAVSKRVADIMRNTPGTVDVTDSGATGQPELVASVDRQKAADLGLSATQIAATMRASIDGVVATQLRPTGQKSMDIRVISAETDRATVDKVLSIPLVTPRGTLVSLGQVATVKESSGPPEIDRRNRQRLVTVGADVVGRASGDVSRDIETALKQLELPAGYSISYGGMTEAQTESFTQLGQALALSIVLMYMLMVALYESLLYPFVIMLSLPLAIAGAIGGLLVTGNTLNMTSMIGMIMLTGLVGKNAILLIDYTNTLRKGGLGRNEALIEAGSTRLRPILMTTAALVVAMFPLALKLGEGAEMRAGMSVVVIGGLLTSTLLTLLVIPSVYTVVDDAQARLFRWLRRGTADSATAGREATDLAH
ncbi:MAG: efflux RND transporter permease subunit [Chloroflexota bacterium]|nr:MAG: efflux RND transporter permease subunit [Chloroflexota bacterium]